MPKLIIYIHSSISTAIISRSEPYTLLVLYLSKATPEPSKDEKQAQKQVQKSGGTLASGAVNILDCIFGHCPVAYMVHDIIRMVIFNASLAVIAKELFLSILDLKE
jgi:hypothetical protein